MKLRLDCLIKRRQAHICRNSSERVGRRRSIRHIPELQRLRQFLQAFTLFLISLPSYPCSRLYSVISAQLIKYALLSPHFMEEYRTFVQTPYCGL